MADYIEKDRVIALIEEKQKELCPSGLFSRNAVYGTDRDRFDAWGEIIDQVDAIPAADVEPVVHAHWIPKQKMVRSPYTRNYSCSHCGHEPLETGERCPHCGAHMDEKV